MDLTCQAWRNARRQDPRDLRNPPAREAGEAVLTLEERLGSMKRGAGRLLVLVLGLVAAGCTPDNIAWLKYRSGLVLTDHRRRSASTPPRCARRRGCWRPAANAWLLAGRRPCAGATCRPAGNALMPAAPRKNNVLPVHIRLDDNDTMGSSIGRWLIGHPS